MALLNNIVDPVQEFLKREQIEFIGLDDEIQPIQSNGNSFFSNILESNSEKNDPGTSDNSTLNVTSHEAERDPTVKLNAFQLWKQNRIKKLEDKDRIEKLALLEWKEKAKADLEKWQIEYEIAIQQSKKKNLKESSTNANEWRSVANWDNVVTLCDLNKPELKQSKHLSRMKSIILKLSKE